MNQTLTRIDRNQGATLVEILVTLFVTSVGLLGVTGLEMVAKNSSYEAVQRTSATLLAHEYIERMRANPAQLASYANVTLGRNSLTQPETLCTAAECTDAQTAAFDLWQWERTLDGVAEKVGSADAGGLLNPTACVTGPNDGSAGTYTIAIAWRGATPLSNPTASDCGEDETLYGTDNIYRRLLTLQVFVSNDGA